VALDNSAKLGARKEHDMWWHWSKEAIPIESGAYWYKLRDEPPGHINDEGIAYFDAKSRTVQYFASAVIDHAREPGNPRTVPESWLVVPVQFTALVWGNRIGMGMDDSYCAEDFERRVAATRATGGTRWTATLPEDQNGNAHHT